MKLNTIGFVSDMHCGSCWGLTPPSWWNKRTSTLIKWMWESWEDMQDKWPPLDLLVLNGDLIDGHQPRSRCTGLLTASLGEQVDIAIECAAGIAAKARKIIRIEGTSAHEDFDGDLSKFDVLYKIKPGVGIRRLVRDIDLGNGAVVNVKHKPEGEGALYRGTTLDREVLWAAITEQAKGLPPATHLVRSHLHSTAHLKGFGKEINLTAGWCLQQPYATQKRYYRWQPDIGGLLMRRDPVGHKGWTSTHTTYDLPKLEVETYDQI